jgi:hypothetical protein
MKDRAVILRQILIGFGVMALVIDLVFQQQTKNRQWLFKGRNLACQRFRPLALGYKKSPLG